MKLDLVSNLDIAIRTGASKPRVANWTTRYSDFPEPLGVVGNGWTRIWLWPDVEAWLKKKWPDGIPAERK